LCRFLRNGLEKYEGCVKGQPDSQISVSEPRPSTSSNIAFQLLAEFIVKMTLEPLLPEKRCIATTTFLDVFPDIPQARAQFHLSMHFKTVV